MTLDQVKILDNKIKANQAQYDLYREAVKISGLSSGELEKYEYLTGEDLGYKSAKFKYCPLGKVLNDKAKSKRDKVVEIYKRDRNLVYNTQYGFVKFKGISDFKDMSLHSMHKKLNEFHKKFEELQNLVPKTKKYEHLKTKTLDDSGNLFNELYYIYK